MKNNKGQALIVVYMVVAFFLIVSAALVGKSFTDRGNALRNRQSAEVFYLAEGAVENSISTFISAIANYQISPSIASYNVSTAFSTFGGITVNTVITRLENAERVITDGSTIIYARNYLFSATAVHPQNNAVSATVNQIVCRRLIPTFQHAVFYNDDLEILPGANMTLSGRIHSNSDIYADSKATLTIDTNYLHSAGDIYNRRKDTGDEDPGEVRISIKNSSPAQYEDMAGLDSESASWQTLSTERWDGTVQSAVHGVTKLATPTVGSIQPGGYYASNADVVIVNGQVTKSGVVLTANVDYPADAVTTTTGTTFKNNRENEYITMTNIDLGKLANADGSNICSGRTPPGPCPNNLPSNGLLYATVTNAGSNEPGIRLVNGGTIARSGGLTVVSNDPVYIQGNYNTNAEQPASVIADALNLLSNNWTDAKSKMPLDSRTATATTVNCAFIAGADTTTSGNYNGGLENYPRLHEKWTNVGLTIKGSFVELWNSAVAHGAWIYGSPQYTAPIRNWSYNTDFNDPAKLPPFTPWAVEAQRISWWKS